MQRNHKIWVVIAVVVFTAAPYIFAAVTAPPDNYFAGVLLNPIDGASYLAKIRQGMNGDWLFSLPFTPANPEGEPIFVFYLFLGHIARWLGLSPLWIFHIARSIAAGLLVLSLARFLERIFPESSKSVYSFLLITFGAGLGWLFFPWVGMTSDFWVAETYPFLAAYANPHFPLGLALLVYLLADAANKPRTLRSVLIAVVGAFLLSIIFPFAVVILVIVQIGFSLWESLEYKELSWQRPASVIIGGLPYLLYQFWIIQSDPLLRLWNIQNQTPSPPIWDLVISLSPALFLAVPGAIYILQKGFIPGRILILWAAGALALLILPVNLQRRFMLGLFIPVAGLAVYGWAALSTKKHWYTWFGRGLMIFSIPTMILVIAAGISGARSLDTRLYLSRSEIELMDWMAQNINAQNVVLAAPESGTFIPAFAGQKVVYGHPFETIQADEMRSLAIKGISGQISFDELNQNLDSPVTYLFWSKREQSYAPSPPAGLEMVHQSGDASLFQIP